MPKAISAGLIELVGPLIIPYPNVKNLQGYRVSMKIYNHDLIYDKIGTLRQN
jgi:hypothetical protein